VRGIHEDEVEGIAEFVSAQSTMQKRFYTPEKRMCSPTIKTGLKCQVLIASKDAKALCPPVTR
jgi:hypothetical protein